MATNTLNASVKINTGNAIRSLQALENRINRIQRLVNGSSNSANQVNRNIQTATRSMRSLNSATQSGTRSANQLAKGFQKTNNAVGALTKNLRTMISTYVGIMGIKAVTGVSDTITSAKNQLNNMDGGNPQLTNETLDKTYSAAQRSRGSYTNMLGNVGKTMTLAGDAFQNNVDNAIRFQEIMSKAYTIGGASAAEQSSSMYQLVQALGSGILQGDELRSVREGAPIAYKQIEKFCQGVLDTTDSLKDLASEGVITSDMVVAAIMNAEEEIETKFKNTTRTFAQAFNQIKNSAIKAFEPVLDRLNSALNSEAGIAIIDGICNALVGLANVTLWLFDIFGSFFGWFADNWYWLQWIVYAVITALIIHLGVLAAQAIWTGLTMLWSFLTSLSPLYLWIIAIGAIIGAIVYLANTASSACEFICGVLIAVALVIAFIGIVTGSTTLLIVACVVAALAVVFAAFMKWGDKITGGIYTIGAFIYNTVVGLIDATIQALWAMCDPVLGIAEFILNACNGGFTGVLGGLANFAGQVISIFLSLGKIITKIIDAICGTNWTSELSSLQEKVLDWGKKEEAITISREAPTVSSIADKLGFDLPDRWAYSDAWELGNEHGTIAMNGLNSIVSSMQNGIADMSQNGGIGDLLDKFGNKFTAGNGLPDPYDPSNALGGAYDPSAIEDDVGNALKKLGNIEDNTDSLKLTSEDVEYLRKIAESEWKKEFTTAEIKVDMTNYNTINDKSDLDGIFTKLSEELLEELNIGADGVYA